MLRTDTDLDSLRGDPRFKKLLGAPPVGLSRDERWRYDLPAGHDVLWTAIASGAVSVPDALRQGDLVAFDSSAGPVDFEARTDTDFVVGSAARHDHDLALGYYSVHTSPAALRDGESHILSIRKRLVQEGRL